MSYLEYQKVWIGGNYRQYIIWENDTTFTDQSGAGNDVVPSFRTTSSDADVQGSLMSFLPITEAYAPAWSLSDVPLDYLTAPNLTADFHSVIAPPYPGADVVAEIAAASSTPSQLPFMFIGGFVILAFSIFTTWASRKFGTTSVFFKMGVIICFMGIAVALATFDWWMLIFFMIPAIAIGFASRPQGVP
jgi:hypothetical protein